MRKLDISKVRPLIDIAVKEDFGSGDPSSALTIVAEAKGKTQTKGGTRNSGKVHTRKQTPHCLEEGAWSCFQGHTRFIR